MKHTGRSPLRCLIRHMMSLVSPAEKPLAAFALLSSAMLLGCLWTDGLLDATQMLVLSKSQVMFEMARIW